MFKHNKFFQTLSWITLALATTVILYFFYMVFWPYKILVNRNPIHVNQSIIYSGQTLKFTVDYCKYMDLPGTVQRRMVDDVVVSFPEVTLNSPVGCRVEQISIPLPKEMSPGPYVLETAVTYHPNLLRAITVRSKSNEFTVRSTGE